MLCPCEIRCFPLRPRPNYPSVMVSTCITVY